MTVTRIGDEVLFNTRERAASDDLNEVGIANELLFEILGGMSGMPNTESGGVLYGCNIAESGGDVAIEKGMGFVYDAAFPTLKESSPVRPIFIDEGIILSHTPESGATNRIDVVLAKSDWYNDEQETRDIFDLNSQQFSATQIYKRKRIIARDASTSLYIKQGTPGAGNPAKDSGSIVLGYVHSSNSAITKSENTRTILVPKGRPMYHAYIDADFASPSVIESRTEGGANATFSMPSAGICEFDLSGFSKRSNGDTVVYVSVLPETALTNYDDNPALSFMWSPSAWLYDSFDSNHPSPAGSKYRVALLARISSLLSGTAVTEWVLKDTKLWIEFRELDYTAVKGLV